MPDISPWFWLAWPVAVVASYWIFKACRVR